MGHGKVKYTRHKEKVLRGYSRKDIRGTCDPRRALIRKEIQQSAARHPRGIMITEG